MKKTIVMLFALCAHTVCVLQGKQHFYQVKSEFLEHYSLVKSRYGRLIRNAFYSVEYLQESKSSFRKYITSEDVKKLFYTDVKQQYVLEQGRTLMLAYLYIVFFELHVKNTYQLLKQVIDAKKYWKYVLVRVYNESYKEYPAALFHSSTFPQLLKKRIALLDSLEEDLAYSLGVAFYGLQKLHSIYDYDIGKTFIYESIQPFYEHQRCSLQEDASTFKIFQDLPNLYNRIQKKNVNIQKILDKHGTPHHILKNSFNYSLLTVGAILGAMWCYKNKDYIPEYRKKYKDSFHYFMTEYVQEPLCGLKKVLWDAPGKTTPQIAVPENFGSCWSLDKAGLQTLGNCIKYTFKEEFRVVNDGIRELKERHQVNYYLSSIMPLVMIVYGLSRYASKVYNHESYYGPMRLIIRDIEVLLNQMSEKKDAHQFADSGRMYLLVSQLKHYTSCLTSEELLMMKDDIKELLSLEYTCKQKQRILERMYRTYHFLK